jgi:hypothetical protein
MNGRELFPADRVKGVNSMLARALTLTPSKLTLSSRDYRRPAFEVRGNRR